MTPAEILAIVQLFAAIEPVALQGINSAINFFNASDLPVADKMKMLSDIQAALKPMVPKE